MGLTRIRAEQISDIDYKQAVRAVERTNVTLSGGAPTLVDGVSLQANDRVLVTGQDAGAENGLYRVQTLGTGSNGTWVRTVDGNETGEIEAGMVIMVTEGDTYKDTLWKLTTNNPIVVGTTPLTFVLNTDFGFGNIYANGTGVTATAQSDVLTLTAGQNMSIVGNATSKSISFAVTGISTANISNGASNVEINGANSNVTVGVSGTGNIAVFAPTGTYITGLVSATGNVIGSYILGNGALLTGVITSVANINNGTSNVTVVSSGGNVTVGVGGTNNIAVFATTGEYVTGVISASGTITGGNLLTLGQISTSGNISGGNLLTSGLISSTGSITSANGITATANITGGNLLTAIVSASGNVTGANYLTAGLISATGNVISGNLLTGGFLSTVGNIYAGTNNTGYVYGNAFYMTGISSAISVTKIENGNSNVWVRDPGGDVTVTAGGVSNVAIFSTGSLAVEGAIGNPKTMAGNVIIANGINATMVGPVEFGAFNLTIPDNSTLYIIPG